MQKELKRITITDAAYARLKKYIQRHGGKKQEVATIALLRGLEIMEAEMPKR